MPEITGFVCPPRCDAGGSEMAGGHVFDREVEFDDGRSWSLACRCGMTAMDWSMWRPNTCEHIDRDDARRVCRDCGEGYGYLGIEAGEPEEEEHDDPQFDGEPPELEADRRRGDR